MFTPHCRQSTTLCLRPAREPFFGQKKFKSKNLKTPVNLSTLRALAGIQNPSPGQRCFYTDALHVVERYTLTDPDTIAYEVTLEDAKAYTRPWKMRFKFNKKPADFELLEYECSENEKDIQHLVGK